jgi:cell pole-organizing protein PopZ
MEDILASIKRVIAEDGRAAPASRASRAQASRAVPLDLTEEVQDEEDILELEDPVSEGDGLVSDDVALASRNALAALASMRDLSEDAGMPAASDGDDALGAAVREMLRPLLKDWLDRNLPDMVEALVTREIARITGKSL